MTPEHQPILILAEGGWFSLIVLLLFALSSLLTKKKKKKLLAEEDDSDDIFDAIEMEHLPPAIRDRIAFQQREIKSPPAIPTLIRAVESLSDVPTARRVVPARKQIRSKVRRQAVQPVQRDEGRSTKAKSHKNLSQYYAPAPKPVVHHRPEACATGYYGIGSKLSAASRLASASPSELRNALVISEILAPPIALREDPAMVRDVRGAI